MLDRVVEGARLRRGGDVGTVYGHLVRIRYFSVKMCTRYEAGSAKKRPRAGSAGARAESRARGTGAVYVASTTPHESVAGGSDGAVVAAAPLCARSRAFVLYRAKR